MIELLTAEQNLPFTVALALMATLAVLEGVSMILGASASGMLDSALPDFDGPDLDLDLDVDGGLDADLDPGLDAGSDLDAHGHGHAGPTELLAWLHFGRVPFLIWLATFLAAFALFGFFVQTVTHALAGVYLPAWAGALVALAGTLPIVRGTVAVLARVLPGDETTAVSELTFVGREAVVTLGTARHGEPAQAKLRDEHGQTHYVMVEPGDPFETFVQGTPVLLVQKNGARFAAVRGTTEASVN